jgi:hypothetical protein
MVETTEQRRVRQYERAKRPKKTTGNGTPVRLDADVVSWARYVVACETDKELGAYLSGILRPVVRKQFDGLGAAAYARFKKEQGGIK